MLSKISAIIVTSIGLVAQVNAQKLDLSGVKLKNISYGGSGCPQGSFVKVQESDVNGTAFVFEPFSVAIGPSASAVSSRSNCQINLDIQYPAGLQYGASSTTYAGYANLDKNVNGTIQTTYYFSGSSAEVTTKIGFTGPLKDEYNVTSSVDKGYSGIVWSPCGSPLPLNINNILRVTSKDSSASGYIQSDGNFASNFEWRKC